MGRQTGRSPGGGYVYWYGLSFCRHCVGRIDQVRRGYFLSGWERQGAAVRDEGTTIHYIPIEYPAVADRHLVDALAVAAENLGYHYAEGITQSKDSFYGQHEPENMPAEARLKSDGKHGAAAM